VEGAGRNLWIPAVDYSVLDMGRDEIIQGFNNTENNLIYYRQFRNLVFRVIEEIPQKNIFFRDF
jgi:hypothetical protein